MLAAFLPEEGALIIAQKAGWAPQPVWALWGREKSLKHVMN